MEDIREFRGEYDFLSNFYVLPFTADGKEYPTVEHAFQAYKTEDMEWREKIRKAETPGQAKRLGRECPMRQEWDVLKVSVMSWLLSLKFENPALREKLLATGDRYLAEGNSWGDLFWGIDEVTGKGENHLGCLLMELRIQLRAADTTNKA